MPLEIKVGHRYRTRSGDVVEITEKDNHPVYPFTGVYVGKNKSIYFRDNGKWGANDSDHDYDLTEELPARCHICGDDTGKHTPDCTSFLPGIYHVAAP